MPEIITRAEAKVRGLEHYFTGKPCLRGHLSERKTISKTCIECVKWKAGNRVVHLQRQRSQELLIEAKKSGLTHYFTGLPCRKGHLSPRYVKNSGCVQCAAVSNLKSTRKRVLYIRQKALERYYKNKPEIRAKARERKRKIAAAVLALKELGIEI